MKKVIENNGKIMIKQGKKFYNCTVKSVCNDDTFYIDRPSREKEGLNLEPGDILPIDYYNEFGTYYELKIKILGKVLEDGEILYRISEPIEAKKIQRRNFVRVFFTEYMLYKAEENNGGYNWERAILLDLSGGGLKLKSNTEMKLGEKFKIKFQYKDSMFSITAVAVRCECAKDRGYICGMEFIDMDEKKRDKIVEKVFEIMRRQSEIL